MKRANDHTAQLISVIAALSLGMFIVTTGVQAISTEYSSLAVPDESAGPLDDVSIKEAMTSAIDAYIYGYPWRRPLGRMDATD